MSDRNKEIITAALSFLLSNLDEASDDFSDIHDEASGDAFWLVQSAYINQVHEEEIRTIMVAMGSGNPYDGAKCPNCKSKDISGDYIDPVGADKAYRDVDCDACGASWTEELTVTGYDHLYLTDETEPVEGTE